MRGEAGGVGGGDATRETLATDGYEIRYPVLCQEAVARRDALIEKLAALPPVPSALDQLVHHFGHDAVAEVTGRSRRVLKVTDARGVRLALRGRPPSLMQRALPFPTARGQPWFSHATHRWCTAHTAAHAATVALWCLTVWSPARPWRAGKSASDLRRLPKTPYNSTG